MEMKFYMLKSIAGGCYPNFFDERSQEFDTGLVRKINTEPNYIIPLLKFKIKKPIQFKVKIEKEYDDTFDSPYYENVSLFRNDLIEAILSVENIHNVQLFDALVTDSKSRKKFTNYKLVNIYGKVGNILKNKETMGLSDDVFPDIAIHASINQNINVKFHIFRIYNSTRTYVDEIVKTAIEKANIENITFEEEF
jgi:hypothetical protein